MINDHLTSEEIFDYANDQLKTEEDENRIIQHLSLCNECLTDIEMVLAKNMPVVPSKISGNIEKRLFKRIHRSNLTGNLITLAIKGFLNVIMGIFTPFVNEKPKDKNN